MALCSGAVKTAIGLAVAGALGALARYGLEGLISRRFPGLFPWGTLVVNVTGSFLLGLLFALLTEHLTVAAWLRTALMIGFVGAYTTFSTFTLETFRLLEDRAYLLAGGYASASFFLGIAAVYGGVVAGRAL